MKKKYHILLSGTFLFCLLAYWLAFGKTWNLYCSVQQLQQQKSSATGILQEINALQKQTEKMNKGQQNKGFTQNYFFQSMTAYCQEQKLAIHEMPQSKIYRQEDLEILQNHLLVEGNFVPMVRLINELEDKQQLGRVVSAEFMLTKNFQSRKNELTAALSIQNIQNTEKN